MVQSLEILEGETEPVTSPRASGSRKHVSLPPGPVISDKSLYVATILIR